MEDQIKKQQLFPHSIEKVWNAITRAEEISSWFLKTEFIAEKGYQYTFNSKDDNCSPITGVVQKADPYELVYTWIVTENPTETLVRWLLTPTQEGTLLVLEHSGIAGYTEATAIDMFNSFNGGWDQCIASLSTYLKKVIHAE